MKVEVKRFNDVLESFVRDDIVPAVKADVPRFLLSVALGSGAVRLSGRWAAMAESAGILSRDGVDTEALRKAASDGFAAAGDEVHLPELGIWLSRSDLNGFIDRLERPAESGGGAGK